MRCAPRASNGPNHLGLCAPPEPLAVAQELVQLAASYMAKGVVGIELSGARKCTFPFRAE